MHDKWIEWSLLMLCASGSVLFLALAYAVINAKTCI